MLRVGIVGVPIVASLATAWTLSALVAVPSTFAGALTRWVLVAAAATLVLIAAERLTRRLAPLATLLALSLTFPDRAPPRFRVSLSNSSTRQMRTRIDEARRGVFGNTPAEAAERVLELVAALSLHDRITRGHSERVRAYSHMIGQELGLDDVELDRLQWAGLLHDVGKLQIPDAILNKPGKLTDEEYTEVQRHPEYGRGMVTQLVPWLGESARAVWEHHERWDGKGYPAGLAGLDIALAARIVAVADTFDVITSARSYKAPVSAAAARAELAKCSGGQFDPVVVRAFLNLSIPRLRLMTGPISWLVQVPLFPVSVLTGAVGGNTATLAATLAVVSAATFGVEPTDTASGRDAGGRDNGSVVGSLGMVPAFNPPPGQTDTTVAVPSGDTHPWAQAPPSAGSYTPVVTPPTPSTSSPPSPTVPIVPTTVARATPPTVVKDPSEPVVTEPSTPVGTTPSTPVETPSPVPVGTPSPVPVVTTTPLPAAPRVDLGAASNFAVLASAAVTSTGPTLITGHVGNTAAAITGLIPNQLESGEIFADSPTTAAWAQSAVANAQLFLNGLTASPLGSDTLGGRTIRPGVYQGGAIALAGTVTLDAEADPNALFVIRAASTLVTVSASRVILVNGAQACNVFWQVGSSATFGTATRFVGSVIANVSITATTGVALDGRLIARSGAITLDSTTIAVPACA